jgi:2,4-dienoyl-CoA reductase-like NADH-dependent reductase (Old Yellow Enzyme family)
LDTPAVYKQAKHNIEEHTMSDAYGRPETAPDIAPLFTPFALNNVTIPNRIVMAPMTRNFCPGGIPGPDVAAYYRRRAENGTGMILTEAICVDHPGAMGDGGLGEDGTPVLHDEAALAGWKTVVAGVHGTETKIFAQLWHMGVMKKPGTGKFPDYPGCRPSGIWGPMDGRNVMNPEYLELMKAPHAPMSESEIADVIAGYARSAAAAVDAGFDGLEIHGAHGYLPDVFLWEHTNRRTDRYGGDHIGRTRFVVELVQAIRAAVGEAFPISLRFSQWKQQDMLGKLAHTPQQLEEILAPIAAAGVDLFDASTRNMNLPEFDGAEMNLAGWTKKLTGKPTMTVGSVGVAKGPNDPVFKPPSSVNNLAAVMARFERGEFDLLGVGRSLLNDPAWTRRARSGETFLPFDPASLRVLT